MKRVTSKLQNTSSISVCDRKSIRHEILSYRASFSGRPFDYEGSQQFWKNALSNGQFIRIGRIARLFMTVHASSIPRERQFSELNRRSAMHRNRTKVDTMDRDAVIF